MSTFSTYDTLIDQKIANTSELFYDAEMRRQAVNDTIREILQRYDIPEMVMRAEIVFDSDGLAAKPSGYYRMIKLWKTDSNGVETSEYNYIETDKFDQLSSSSSYYWTEDYIVADAVIELKVLPTDSGTLDIRYIKKFMEMTDSITDSGLSNSWDEAIALGAASRLFVIANRYDEAREYQALYERKVKDTYGVLKNPGGYKQGSRLKSKWERQSLLGGFSSGSYDN